VNRPEYQQKVMRKYGFRDWDALLASVGHGALKEGQIVNKLEDLYKKDHQEHVTDEQILSEIEDIAGSKPKTAAVHSKSGIVVRGLEDLAVRFSKCCSPIPGDEIVGFVTRGRGVSIHRTDCVNVLNLSDMDRARLIDAEWSQDAVQSQGRYAAEIRVFANNRTGLLADISRIVTERSIDIESLSSKTNKQGIATLELMFSVKNKNELAGLIDKIRQIESVLDIERTTG
jgi:GTP pyrophosphokinase